VAEISQRLYLPALKGVFGKWFYYSALMSVSELAGRVSFAKELQKSEGLSDLLQRELKGKRQREIADYLEREPDRFFNSLVIAVYGGHPTWYPATIVSAQDRVKVNEIPDKAQQSIGLLCLGGSERLFAVDGQHRLAGVKEATKRAQESEDPSAWGDKFLDDEISVVFIGHEVSPKGLERTRRVFTTLNKTARPVSKGDIIALDENDVMAIICRRMVEDHPFFIGPRVAIRATNNLSPKDVSSLITIGALYDVLTILFSKIGNGRAVHELRFGNRPEGAELDEYFKRGIEYFHRLGQTIPELLEYFESKNLIRTVSKYRGEFGGHLGFRPIGLLVITSVVARLCRTMTLRVALGKIKTLPMLLQEPPLADVIWNTKTRTIQAGKRSLAARVYLAKLGYLTKRKLDEVSLQYSELTERKL